MNKFNPTVSTPSYEVLPRVANIEQQLKTLPLKWQLIAGPPPNHVSYYEKKINLFRENRHLKPSKAYTSWVVKAFNNQLPVLQQSMLSRNEIIEIMHQEWRTNITQKVWESRLNRHDLLNRPRVERSKNGTINITFPN